MDDHDVAVGRPPHVELDHVGAGAHRCLERGHGVLGRFTPVAAVRERQWHYTETGVEDRCRTPSR